MGVPWHFRFDNVDELAPEARMVVVDKVKMADLHRANALHIGARISALDRMVRAG